MSSVAAAGAVSRKSMVADEPSLFCTTMNPPPPMPDECELTTPMQRSVAMAASTALPLSARTPAWSTGGKERAHTHTHAHAHARAHTCHNNVVAS